MNRWVRHVGSGLLVCLSSLVMVPGCPAFASCPCEPSLWPSGSFSLQQVQAARSSDEGTRLLVRAEQLLERQPAAVAVLHSAGVRDPQDPRMLRSRRGFKDADRAALLAVAFTLTQDPRYLTATRRLLIAWATTNQPTGHPIDETRLDGFVWAFDTVRCDLDEQDRQQVVRWLSTLAERKRAWVFGTVTRDNNHMTHHLKMLVLLDAVLCDRQSWSDDIEAAEEHAQRNIDSADGRTRDHVERDALFYHAYDLTAWMELALVSGCCQEPVQRAFDFLETRLRTGEIYNEFAESQAPLDAARAAAGFRAYQSDTFDPRRADRALITQATRTGVAGALPAGVDPDASDAIRFAMVRRALWIRR